MQSRYATVLAASLLAPIGHAGLLTVHIDGSDRGVDSKTRGAAGRAAWTATVAARDGTIATDDFNGVDIDVPVDTLTPVGHFSVYFEQTGGYSPLAGNTAPEPHPTGVFVGTTGTGSAARGNAETIDGLELRYETHGPVTQTLELRFDPPVFAWSADIYSVDGISFGEGLEADSNDHTTLHVLEHSFDLTEALEYAGSGYMSFFGIVSEQPFSVISFTAEGDGDRFRLDNVSIAR